MASSTGTSRTAQDKALLKYLQYRADTYRCAAGTGSGKKKPQKVPHDAARLCTFVRLASLGAAGREEAPQVKAFALTMKSYLETDSSILRDEALAQMLYRVFLEVSTVFFFDLPTRWTKNADRKLQPLVGFQVETDSKGNVGSFNYHPNNKSIGHHIIIRLRTPPGSDNREFWLYIDAVVHQTVRAFLKIFSDQNHPNFQEGYEDAGGYGIGVWRLITWITDRMYLLTKCSTVRSAMKRQKFAIHQQIRKSHLAAGSKTCFKGCTYGCDDRKGRRSVASTEPQEYLDVLWTELMKRDNFPDY